MTSNPDAAAEAPGQARADIRASGLILAPGLAVALLVYLTGARDVAIGIAGLAFVVTVIVSPQVGLYAYLAWQALDAAVITEEAAQFTPAKGFAAFLLLVYLFWYGRSGTRLLVSKPVIVLLLVFGVYGLATAVLAVDQKTALRYSGQIIVQAILVVMSLHLLNNRAYVRRAMLWTIVGGLVAGGLLLVGGGVSGQYTRATLGEFANPNTTALALSIALIAIPGAWAYGQRRIRYYILFGIAGPIILVAMLKTGSRSALISLFAAILLGAALARGAGLMKRMLVGLVCAAAAGYTLFAVLQAGVLDEKSQARIEALFHDSGSISQDSRTYIWGLALKTYVRSPATGFGYGNTAAALERYEGFYKDIHSSYLGALVDGGPIGFALMMYALWRLVRCVRGAGGSRASIAAAMILVLLLMSCITHTIHFSKWFWVPLTLCLLLVEQAERERRQQLETPAAPMPARATPARWRTNRPHVPGGAPS